MEKKRVGVLVGSLRKESLQQPEAYIGNVTSLLDDSGKLTNEGTREFLEKFMNAFGAWVVTNAPKK